MPALFATDKNLSKVIVDEKRLLAVANKTWPKFVVDLGRGETKDVRPKFDW